jgi:hypothetical protein
LLSDELQNAINATYLGWVLPTRTFFADVSEP